MPKMSDATLADTARQYKELDTEIKNLEKEKSKLKDKLLKEMERRQTTGIVTNGVKITYVQQERTVYDEGRIRRMLGKERWLKASTRVLDKDKLMDLVHSGTVDIARVEKTADIVPNAPYPSVTLIEDK